MLLPLRRRWRLPTPPPNPDLDLLAHTLQFQGVVCSTAKPKAVAGDVAARAPRRVGAEFIGGITALLYAAREGRLESARALVEGGADLNIVNGDKFSPLVMAITNGHYDVARCLLWTTTPTPNLTTQAGLTALFAVIDVQWAPHAWFPQPNVEPRKAAYLDLNGFLFWIIAQKELPDDELRSFQRADADEKCAGAGAPSEAGGFRVEVNQPLGRGQGGLGEEQVQWAQVGDGDVANPQFAIRSAEWKRLPGDKVFAQFIFLEHAFHIFFDALGRSLRRELARLRRLIHAAQIFQSLLKLASRVARCRGFLKMAEFLVEVHRYINRIEKSFPQSTRR